MRTTTELSGYGPVSAWHEPHSGDDDERTEQTTRRMVDHIREAGADPAIRDIASRLVRKAGGRGPAAVLDEVFYCTQNAIRFVDDPPGQELLIEPSLMVRLPDHLRQGDCDDFTMLAGGLLEAIGIPWRVVTIKADPNNPEMWTHVYLEAELDGEWMALDTSHGPEPGWSAPRKYGLRAWGGGEGSNGMGGLGFDFGPVGAPGTVTGGGVSWKDALLNTGLQVGQQFGGALATRIAVPEGTYLQTSDGVIARGGPSYGASLPVLAGGMDILPWAIGLGLLGVVVVVATKR